MYYQLYGVSLLYQVPVRTRKPKIMSFENIIKVFNCIEVTEKGTNIENKCTADNILLSDKLFSMVIWVFTSLT